MNWKIAIILTILFVLVAIARAKGLFLHIRNIAKDLPTGPGEYKTRKLSDIDTLVVHHSDQDNQTPLQYANYHIDSHGWPGIGYHYVIDPGGRVEQTNDLKTVSYHVKGNNTGKVGICLSGDLDNHPMTDRQERSLLLLIRRLKTILPGPLEIRGHGELSATLCPGLHTDMNLIRSKI